MQRKKNRWVYKGSSSMDGLKFDTHIRRKLNVDLKRTILAEASGSEQHRLRRQDLASKVFVVTGASKGIGRARVFNLASRACSVIGTCLTDEGLHLIDTIAYEMGNTYSAHGQPGRYLHVVGITGDIFSPGSDITIADAVEKHFGYLNIIILNAGATRGGSVGDMTIENIQHSCLGGVQAPVMTVEEFVKRKLFRQESRTVYISSTKAGMGNPGA